MQSPNPVQRIHVYLFATVSFDNRVAPITAMVRICPGITVARCLAVMAGSILARNKNFTRHCSSSSAGAEKGFG